MQSAKIRLVHVTTVPESFHFFMGQIGFMKARGVDVHALSSPDEALLEAVGAREGIPVHPVEMPRRISPLRDLAAVWRTVRVLRRVRPQIVHAHTPKGGLLGTIAAWLTRAPVRIYHIHGLPFITAAGHRRTLLRWTEKIACALAHQVLCVSDSVRDVAVEEGLCPPHRIKVLLGGSINGVDALGRFDPAVQGPDSRAAERQRLGIPEEAVVLGFVGRVVREKGIGELVEAWTSIRDTDPRLHLVVAGPIQPQDPVPEAVMDTLRRDPRIRLTGPVDPAPLFAAMDVLVLPTYREGFPNVPLEAAAMGLPVVSTQVPGCVDAVQDGVTGLLVPAQDADALASAIQRYLGDPDLREAHGRAGRERVLRDFRREAIWEALYDEYLRLMSESGIQHSGSGRTDASPSLKPVKRVRA